MAKVYALELWADPESSGSSAIFEVAGISTDRAVLERLKVEKEKWLDEYFSDERNFDDDTDEYDDEYQYVLFNTDLSGRPYWSITEYDLLEASKKR